MRWRSEAVLQELIEVRERELFSEMRKHPCGAFEPSEATAAVMMELMDLENELEFVREKGPDSGERDALVRAPLHPMPGLHSGAIAPPEPDEPHC